MAALPFGSAVAAVAAAAAAAVVAATLLLSEEELECKAEAVPPQLGPVRREKDQHQ